MLQWGNKQGKAALALTLLGALGAGAAALLARRDRQTAQALAAQRLEENRCLQSKNQALEERLRRTEAGEDAKRDFLANLSHDIRMPVNAVLGFAALAEQNIDDREKLVGYLDKLRCSGEHLRAVFRGTEVTRMERGEDLVREEPCDFQALANAINDSFEPIFREKNLRLETRFWVPHDQLITDPTRIRQIICPLLENAAAYTPEGGRIVVSVRETPSGVPGIVRLITTVEDNGPGIPVEKQEHLFDFPRDRRPGGLVLACQRVRQLGGVIHVDSTPGHGTRVTVTMDHKIASAAKRTATPVVGDEDIRAIAAGKRILLAEDNDLNAEIVTEVLTGLGFQVERARDGADCVEMLDKAGTGYYNLILMDIQMPNMNGYLATRTIRRMEDRAKRSVPIAALTASALAEDRERALEQGMDGFIAKPIDVSALAETLAEIFR